MKKNGKDKTKNINTLINNEKKKKKKKRKKARQE